MEENETKVNFKLNINKLKSIMSGGRVSKEIGRTRESIVFREHWEIEDDCISREKAY